MKGRTELGTQRGDPHFYLEAWMTGQGWLHKGGKYAEVFREEQVWDFPGGPVVKALHFQCRGHRFDPWSGN